MLAMAVPGTVLGVGYIRGFAGGVFRTGFLQGHLRHGADPDYRVCGAQPARGHPQRHFGPAADRQVH